MRTRTANRRGNYSIMFGIGCLAMMGFGAFAVDVSLIRLAQSQAQTIADAASQAGLYVLRTSGSLSQAEDAAERVINKNLVAGIHPEIRTVDFGVWEDGAYHHSNSRQNAIKVTVGREVDLPLGTIFGIDEVDVERTATSAARALHVVLVMDITNSWTQANFANARTAAVSFLETVAPTAGPDDKIGMVVFTGRYGVEHSPMVMLVNALDLGLDDTWNALRTASKAGFRQANGNCNVFPYANSRYTNNPTTYPTNEFGLTSDTLNNSSWPANYFKLSSALPANLPKSPRLVQTSVTTDGGCYPNMWREYIDESGTDHTVGVEMAATMLKEQTDQGAYRAMVILTDGQPNGTGAHTQRAAAGNPAGSAATAIAGGFNGDLAYVDPRWKPAGSNPPGTIGRYYMGPTRTTAQIQTVTASRTASLYTQDGINTWIISFVDGGAWMDNVDQGDGYYINTNSSSALIDIFNDIAESLPVAIVE